MRNLNTNTNHVVETKFWQGWLNTFEGEKLKIDGGYGDLTKKATERYQTKYNLEHDGNAGQITLNHAGFLTTKNSKIVVLEIPFNRIEKANVLLKDGQAYNCKRFADEGGYNIAWNAAFFNMSNRKIVQFVSIAGQVKQYGMANTGIAYPNNWANVNKAMPKTRNQAIGQPFDMQAGAPVLIQNGISNIDKTGIANSILTQVTERNCTGIKNDSLLLFFTISGCTLYEMRDEGLYQKVVYLQGNDGGGSKGLYMGGGYIFSGRAIPCAVGLRIKPSVITPTPSPTKKPKVAIDSGHHAKTAGKMSVDGTLKEYEFNMDISKRVQSHLTRHGVESKIFQSTNSNLKQELLERIAWNDAYKPDISLSVHSNAFGDGKTWNDANGWEVFYSTGSVNGKRLAECIHSTSIPFLGLTDRGVKDTRTLAMVRRPYAPSVLIEHGFMTNKVECELLKSDDFRNKCAIADAKGILKYFSIPWIEPKVEVKPVTKPETDILYKVQVGAFGNKENAERLQDTLESLGYDTIIKEEKRDK